MRAKRLFLTMALAAFAVASVVAPAAAVPLIEGESDLVGIFSCTGAGFSPPCPAKVRVDWQVYSPGSADAPLGATADFQYVYQIEATTAGGPPPLNDVGQLTITFPGPAFTSITSMAGNLIEGNEFNPADLDPLTCCVAPTGSSLTALVATWSFSPKIPHDGQSTLLIGLNPTGPTFGGASALDGLPGSPWSSAAPGGEQVPVPAPEPGTLLLLGSGLVGLVAMRRRK